MPLTQGWLDAEKARGGRVTLGGKLEDFDRQLTDIIAGALKGLPPPSGNVERIEKVIEGGPRVLISIPKAAKESKDGFPVGVYAHGGGYCVGSADQEAPVYDMWAEMLNVVYVNVAYRHAPQHKAPAQIEDFIKAIEWGHDGIRARILQKVAANAASIHGDPNNIYTHGISAGGGLALASARKIKLGQTKVDPKVLKGVIAITPTTVHPNGVPENLKDRVTSHSEHKGTPMIDQNSIDCFYAWTGADPKDPDYFTLVDQGNYHIYPPTYFVTAELDPIRDDGKVMAENLAAAGVPVKHDHYPNLPHIFWVYGELPETQQYYANLGAGYAWLKSQF